MELGSAVRQVEATGRPQARAEGGSEAGRGGPRRPGHVPPGERRVPARACAAGGAGRRVPVGARRREPRRGEADRVVEAFVSGSRARRSADGPVVLPSCGATRAPARVAVRPAPRASSTVGGPCMPARRVRLGHRGRPGGARRLAGEVRAGAVDRVLAALAVGLGSATVVVLLGLLADLAGTR